VLLHGDFGWWLGPGSSDEDDRLPMVGDRMRHGRVSGLAVAFAGELGTGLGHPARANHRYRRPGAADAHVHRTRHRLSYPR